MHDILTCLSNVILNVIIAYENLAGFYHQLHLSHHNSESHLQLSVVNNLNGWISEMGWDVIDFPHR
jgi:hypothetical protein